MQNTQLPILPSPSLFSSPPSFQSKSLPQSSPDLKRNEPKHSHNVLPLKIPDQNPTNLRNPSSPPPPPPLLSLPLQIPPPPPPPQAPPSHHHHHLLLLLKPSLPNPFRSHHLRHRAAPRGPPMGARPLRPRSRPGPRGPARVGGLHERRGLHQRRGEVQCYPQDCAAFSEDRCGAR